MNEIRDILGKALPETPPIGLIDRDRAIAAGRRARERRRWMITTVAGISTLLVGAGVATAATLPGGSLATTQIGTTPSAAASAAPSASVSPSPGARPTPSEPPPYATLDPSGGPDAPPSSMLNANPRLTDAFKVALAAVAPTVESGPVRGAFANRDVDAFEVIASQGGYKVWAELSDSEGVGTLFAYLDRVDFAAVSDGFGTHCPQGYTCETRHGPNGEIIVIQRPLDTSNANTMNHVTILKPDGTSLDVMVDNYSHGTRTAQRATPPLTVEQIILMMLEPTITLS